MTKDELFRAVAVARTSNNEGTRTALMVDALLDYIGGPSDDTANADAEAVRLRIKALEEGAGTHDLDLLQSAIEKAQGDIYALTANVTPFQHAVGSKLTDYELSLADLGGRLTALEGIVEAMNTPSTPQPADPPATQEPAKPEFLCTVAACERAQPGAGYRTEGARNDHVKAKHPQAVA